MIATIFNRSVRDLFIPDMLKLFLICLFAYIAGAWTLVWIVGNFITSLAGATGGQGFVLHWAVSIGGFAIVWFLFPLLYPILLNFFDDKIFAVIEQQDYPQIPP